MKRKRVRRFLFLLLVAGGFTGLIAGLAFGGPRGDRIISVVDGSRTASQSPASTVAATASDGQPMTPNQARTIGANEMGLVLVVVYNNISPDGNSSTTRTPDGLRDDLSLLWSQGFYPVNLSDLATGDIDIPAGKYPVAITFDGSSPGQYRILDDGTLDSGCAVGIMEDLVKNGYWYPRATFFCLTDVVPSENRLFGQSELYREKLRNLTDWGYEVGSNTMTGLNLAAASDDSIRTELAGSQQKLNDLIGSEYAVTSLAVPGGRFPERTSLLGSGTWEGDTYEYSAVVGLDDGFCHSPVSTYFDPLRIPRIVSAGDGLSAAIQGLLREEDLIYISDGDPVTISAPADLDPRLGEPRTDLGRPVIRY